MERGGGRDGEGRRKGQKEFFTQHRHACTHMHIITHCTINDMRITCTCKCTCTCMYNIHNVYMCTLGYPSISHRPNTTCIRDVLVNFVR